MVISLAEAHHLVDILNRLPTSLREMGPPIPYIRPSGLVALREGIRSFERAKVEIRAAAMTRDVFLDFRVFIREALEIVVDPEMLRAGVLASFQGIPMVVKDCPVPEGELWLVGEEPSGWWIQKILAQMNAEPPA